MEHDGANDLLALSAYLGDAVPPAVPDAPPPRTRPRDDLPMSEEQAAFMVYLSRRIGRGQEATSLTFSEAKRRISELLDELSA